MSKKKNTKITLNKIKEGEAIIMSGEKEEVVEQVVDNTSHINDIEKNKSNEETIVPMDLSKILDKSKSKVDIKAAKKTIHDILTKQFNATRAKADKIVKNMDNKLMEAIYLNISEDKKLTKSQEEQWANIIFPFIVAKMLNVPVQEIKDICKTISFTDMKKFIELDTLDTLDNDIQSIKSLLKLLISAKMAKELEADTIKELCIIIDSISSDMFKAIMEKEDDITKFETERDVVIKKIKTLLPPEYIEKFGTIFKSILSKESDNVGDEDPKPIKSISAKVFFTKKIKADWIQKYTPINKKFKPVGTLMELISSIPLELTINENVITLENALSFSIINDNEVLLQTMEMVIAKNVTNPEIESVKKWIAERQLENYVPKQIA